jgi:hypothetical protein
MTKRNENYLVHFLKLIDLFGVEPKLLYKNSTQYKTSLGGFLSIIVGITFALAFYAFGKDIFEKELPTTIFSNNYYISPERFNLTQDNFNFFIGIQGTDYEYYIDPTIINVNVAFNKFTKILSDKGEYSFKYDSVNFKAEPCDLQRHFGKLAHLFKNEPLNNLMCVDPESQKQMYLEGTFGQDKFFFIQIQLAQCQNSTIPGSPVCKSEEYIKNFLDGGFFVVNIVDTIFNPKNYISPNEYVLRNFYTTFSNKYFKEYNFMYRNVDYVTDTGFLIEKQETQNFLSLENTRELIDLRSSKIFLSSNIRLSNFKDNYLRRYVKIQDVLAQIGGLVKGIILFVNIIIFAFVKTEYYLDLANSIYYFSQGMNDLKIYKQQSKLKNTIHSNRPLIKIIQSINPEPNPLNSVSNTKNISNIEIQAIKFPSEIEKNLGYFEEKKLKISSSFLKTLKIILPINFKDNRIVYSKKVVNSIKSSNNIENLIRLMEDFSHLKNILLNEDQKKLFELNSKVEVYDYADRLYELSRCIRNQDLENLKNISKFQSSDTISINLKNQLIKKLILFFNDRKQTY